MASVKTIIRISADRHERLRQFLADLWDYRELFWTFVERDIKVRYKQTALGVIWVVLQPLLMTAVFTLIFGKLAGMPSEKLPYAVFALSGLLPWNFFSGALTRGGVILVNSAQLISKVYFPRLIMPVASVMGGLLDFLVVFVFLIGLMFFYGLVPTAAVIWLPFFLLVAIATALGVSFWLSALNVRYRDVNYLIPFMAQFWMFATPVVYPASMIPDRWRLLYGLNPMVGVVEGFRWALFGTGEGPGWMMLVSIVMVVILLITGILVFRKMERTFADVV
ncbi:MAG: ABC transporter permease [Verrucomicrobia bacterium]|nr:ABC transporter permease [Verrucomicrobiota bacterium]